MAIHPSIVPAHWTPRFSIICREKSGNEQPIADRKMVFAAIVDAALSIGLVTRCFTEENQKCRQGNIQRRIAVNDIIETLQEDQKDPRSGEEP